MVKYEAKYYVVPTSYNNNYCVYINLTHLTLYRFMHVHVRVLAFTGFKDDACSEWMQTEYSGKECVLRILRKCHLKPHSSDSIHAHPIFS